MRAEYGLIGGRLGHSFSPRIHRELGGYDYELVELKPEEVGTFLRTVPFRGINVTIPYKQTVIPFLDEISENARRIGSVNTILRRRDGSLIGDNTDDPGFRGMLRQAGIDPAGRKCLVLGSGGASRTVVACLGEMGAREVRVISRRGEDNYGNLEKHRDAEIIVNATPVGMYPDNGAAPLKLEAFPALQGVADLIYRPARTALLLEAERLGIRWVNGLYMLMEQARCACEIFLGRSLPEAETDRVTALLAADTANLILASPGGKAAAAAGRTLGERTGRKLADGAGMTGGKIREAGKETGLILTLDTETAAREEHRDALRQNGILFRLGEGREGDLWDACVRAADPVRAAEEILAALPRLAPGLNGLRPREGDGRKEGKQR